MNDNTCEGDDYLDYFVYTVYISPVNLVPLFFLLVIGFSDLAIPVIQVGHHPSCDNKLKYQNLMYG